MRSGFYETNPPTLKKEEAYREVAALRDDGQVKAEPRVHRAVLEDHDRGYADHGQRLYALLMLELWKKGVG